VSVTALFIHGWGFDSGIWDRIVPLLPGWTTLRYDRGYFGAAQAPSPDGPCIAVTHSFGTMLALTDPPAGCIGILAINGFDRFIARTDSPGVQPRVLERMIGRFEKEPEATLQEFRHRCGSDASFPACDTKKLGADLRHMAEMDCTRESALAQLPILSLQGEADRILPAAMREAVFSCAGQLERKTLSGNGHLLPLTAPQACASTIREFARVLA